MSAKKGLQSGLPHTKPEVFIVETLAFEDEVANRSEGKVLADVLRLAGKHPAYYYFRSERELKDLAQLYSLSKYRYLHLSCHATPGAILTTLGSIPVQRFATIFQNQLILRRLFVSACELGSGFLSTYVADKNKGMHSIACPIDKIRFDRAVALWTAFYVRMFDVNNDAMSSKNIGKLLRNLCQLFCVRFRWDWYSANSDGWRNEEITDTLVAEVPRPRVPKPGSRPPTVPASSRLGI